MLLYRKCNLKKTIIQTKKNEDVSVGYELMENLEGHVELLHNDGAQDAINCIPFTIFVLYFS
jgi:hypothetical protein